jgi:hypothetical protein
MDKFDKLEMSFAELMGIDNEYELLSKTEKVCQHIYI